MDIKVKRTNRIFWDVSPETAAILGEMFPDQIERLHLSFHEKQDLKASLKPVNTAKPVFGVARDPMTEKYRIVMRCGPEEAIFDGPAVHAATAFGGGERTVPQAVINEYIIFVGDGKPMDLHFEIERRLKAKQAPAQPSWPRYK